MSSPTVSPVRASAQESLQAVELSVRFGGTQALDKVTAELPTGTVLGVVGPNGAGKSTLVNVLSGHVRPDHGEIRIHDADGPSIHLTRRPPAVHWRNGIARSFQGMRLYARLNVLENVVAGALGSIPSGLARVRGRAHELLAGFGLQDVADRFPSELSVGQSKLVGVARALVSSPRFILLDEPLAGLDRSEVADFLPVIRHTAAELGAGVLLIDHDLEAISEVCDQIVVMSNGAILASGGREIFNQESVQRAYMGTQSASAFREHWRSSNR